MSQLGTLSVYMTQREFEYYTKGDLAEGYTSDLVSDSVLLQVQIPIENKIELIPFSPIRSYLKVKIKDQGGN